MKIALECLHCGQAFRLERPIEEPEVIRVTCPRCEHHLKAEITAEILARDFADRMA